jgi:iron complex transport system substrate-binding protein
MRKLLLVVALICGLMTAACGSDDDTESAAVGGSESSTTDEATFPQTVEHKYGSTTVNAKPERIVIVGLTEQDTVLQLGYQPIATTEWYGDHPSAVWPWAQDELTTKPTVLHPTDGLQFEKIASLRPDLIIGVNAGLTRKDYDKLVKIAPTLAAGKGSYDYFSAWDQQVELISQALGKPEQGKALIQKVRDDYAKVAAEHPQFQGKTATFSQNAFYDGQLYVYPDSLGTDFLTMLGFTINPKLAKQGAKPGEQAAIAAEKLDVIDADVIVFATEKTQDIAELKKVPTFKHLEAIKGKHAVFTDPTLSGAMYFLTPLALEYVLDKLPPALDEAVAGASPQELVGG